jgi:hypothetical protein
VLLRDNSYNFREMRMKTLYAFVFILLAVPVLYGQPTNGPVYWSTTQPDCSSLGESPVPVKNAAGTTLGYSCYVSGTFLWLAAGGGWGTSIRVAAPASAPVGVDYTFYDPSGNKLSLDTTMNNASSSFASGNQVAFALNADQPSEVELLGGTGNGTGYSSTTTGSVYGVFYCPDAATCNNVLPQLIYSALPAQPWSVSVPISFDGAEWTQWSAVGINGSGQSVALAIYNADATANTYKISVFDSSGNLVGSGTTASIRPRPNLGNNTYGQGGTYGVFLSQIVPGLPQGVLKVVVDGGSYYSVVEVLQFNGPSATALQVAYDSPPPAHAKAVFAGSNANRPRLRAFSNAQ